MAKVSHLTSETVDSVADPDCREMTEKANHHSDKLAMEQDFRAAVSKAGLPSDGLSEGKKSQKKREKPSKCSVSMHRQVLVCLKTYVMRAASL